MLQGQYRFGNDTLLNSSNMDSSSNHIVQHENAHKVTTSMSSLGFFIIMLEKISLIDDSKKWLMDELITSFNKAQEISATLIEYLWILENNDEDYFNQKVQELKSNKKYYKYLCDGKKLINKQLSKSNVKEIAEKVFYATTLSLDIDINQLKLWEFSSSKDWQRFISQGDNSKIFLPNNRFKIIMKHIFQGSEADLVELIYNATFKEENPTKMCRETIMKLFSNSSVLNIIQDRIDALKFNNYIEVNSKLNCALLEVFPFKDTNEKLQTEYIELTDILKKLTASPNQHLHFNNLLGGLEFISLLYIYDRGTSKQFISQYDISSLMLILSKVNNTIVFHQFKLFSRIKNLIENKLQHKMIYIVMEQSLLSSLQNISEYFQNQKFCLIEMEGYSSLVFCRNNITLVQICSTDLTPEMCKDIFKSSGIEFDVSLLKESSQEDIVKLISQDCYNMCSIAIANKEYGFK